MVHVTTWVITICDENMIGNTKDVSGLELRAEFDLAARFFAVDEDEVRVMRIQEVVECRIALIVSIVINRFRH